MGVDYVELKIDTDRDTNGAAVAARLRKGESGGIPWMVILDAKGAPKVTSDGPKGNVVFNGATIWWANGLPGPPVMSIHPGMRSNNKAQISAFSKSPTTCFNGSFPDAFHSLFDSRENNEAINDTRSVRFPVLRHRPGQ